MREDSLRPQWQALLQSVTPYALLVVAVFSVYANVYSNEFFYDDNVLITHNSVLKTWHPFLYYFTQPLGFESSYYRPFQTLLYTLIFHLSGLSPFAFHFINIVLHAANACLVYMLGQRLKFNPLASCAAALIWALHPIQTEAVTYMSATADVLSAFFCLTGVLVLFPDFASRRIVWAAGLMLCGLFSKESVCVFPLLAASCLYFQSEKPQEIKTYRRLWPLALIAIVYTALRFIALPPQSAGGKTDIAVPYVDYAPFAAFARGFKLLLWPMHLHMGYELPVDSCLWHVAPLVGVGLIGLISVSVACFEVKEKKPLLWGFLWFLAAYSPSFLVYGFFYEHWLYLPSIGLFLGLTQSVPRLLKKAPVERRKLIIASLFLFTCVIITGLATLTYKQNQIWRDPVTFYSHVFAQGESAAKLHYNLGLFYAFHGENEKALAQYQIAIQNSHDALAEAHIGIAALYMHMSDDAEYIGKAKEELAKALEIDTTSFIALDDLAILSEKEGDEVGAAQYRAQAEKIRNTLHITPELELSLSYKG